MNILQKIQSELKVPKSQYNSFGKYNYRSCEDILEAVKPVLAQKELSLIISDDLINFGERFYVRATAIIYDKDGQVVGQASALAREAQSRKGMDESQLTGATSSYARKYALNGLFALDDTKDADATNKGNDKQQKQQITKVNEKFLQKMGEIKEIVGADAYYKVLGNYGFEEAGDILDRPSQIEIYKEIEAQAL